MIGRSEQTISNSFNCFFDVYFLQNSNSQEPKMSKVGEVQFLKAVKMQNKLGRRANSCEKCETIAIKLMEEKYYLFVLNKLIWKNHFENI